jgi:carbamoyltransferase
MEEFKKLTGCPVLINTSFNVRGEPIVSSPREAWETFIKTEMDYLIFGNYLVNKEDILKLYPFRKPEISPEAD